APRQTGQLIGCAPAAAYAGPGAPSRRSSGGPARGCIAQTSVRSGSAWLPADAFQGNPQVLGKQRLPERDGDDVAGREALGRDAVVVLGRARAAMHDVARSGGRAADRDVGVLAAAGEGVAEGQADAEIEPAAGQGEGARVGEGPGAI